MDIQSSSTTTIVAFPKLKKLTFYECRKWKEWEDITAEEEEHSTIMPRLTHLAIGYSSSLTKLPRRVLSKAWPLEELDVSGSMELQQYCREAMNLSHHLPDKKKKKK